MVELVTDWPILIDLDDTIVKFEGIENYANAKPIEGAREALYALVEQGFQLMYFTSRWNEDREATEAWLSKHTFPVAPIMFKKPIGVYVGDDAVHFDGDWSSTLPKVLERVREIRDKVERWKRGDYA